MQSEQNANTLYEGNYLNEFFPQKLHKHLTLTLPKTSAIPTDVSAVTIQDQRIT